MAERDVDFDGISDYFPPDQIVAEPADCRTPCSTTWEREHSGLYRDPKPEVVRLFRTKELCVASPKPGLFPMPKSDCRGD